MDVYYWPETRQVAAYARGHRLYCDRGDDDRPVATDTPALLSALKPSDRCYVLRHAADPRHTTEPVSAETLAELAGARQERARFDHAPGQPGPRARKEVTA